MTLAPRILSQLDCEDEVMKTTTLCVALNSLEEKQGKNVTVPYFPLFVLIREHLGSEEKQDVELAWIHKRIRTPLKKQESTREPKLESG